jgi:CelD/BcsL family acetyltransferase involved in cellulose biosynthesis
VTANSPVTVEVVDRLDVAYREWDQLATATSAPPFVFPDWIGAWQRWFGNGRLRLFVARRGSELVGVLPLVLHRRALRSPTNPHSPLFDLVARDEEAAHALALTVLSASVRRVDVHLVDGSSLGFEALRSAASHSRHRQIVRLETRAPFIRCSANLAAHRASLSRNLRHDTDRRLRRLAEAGAVSIQVATGGEHLDPLLREAFTVEELGWKGIRGSAIASQDDVRNFYGEIARWATGRGWLRLAFLRLDGRAIAMQFDLEVGRTYYSLKIGYDPAYEHFAPGKLLTYAMVARAVASGAETYELLGKDEEWKYRFTNTSRERFAFAAFPRSPGGLLSWSASTYGLPIARRIPLAARVRDVVRQ